ncbi:MAG: ribosome maturation factor [Chitinophagaceae bacterium]
MQNEAQIHLILQLTEALLEGDKDLFLIEVKIALGNHIKVFLDGDSGITIEKCVSLNRALYKQIEEKLYPNGEFSLEVSSPGLDEPLKLHRQYLKNVGRKVEVVLTDGTRAEGKLVAVSAQNIDLEEVKGKKNEVIRHSVLFQNIKTTKIQVVF